MFAQVDDEGNQYLLMNDIMDHRKENTAIPISDGMTCGHNGHGFPEDNYVQLGVFSRVEQWFNKLDETQGYEGVHPDRSCRVCCHQSYCWGSSL